MEKNRMGLIKRLKTLMSVFAVAVVAMVGLAAAPQDALAYNTEPIQGLQEGPGFKWIDPGDPDVDDEGGYYIVYDPLKRTDWAGGTQHESCAGWYYFVAASRTYNFDGYLIKLDSDIDFKQFDWDRNSNAGRTQLTVGSEDLPFAGTFDGQNYTISNLSNNRDGLLIVTDCGFFGVTDGATIKSLKLADCYVGGSFRSAVLVGLAENTLIENVTLTNCESSVIPGNSVINLVTNAGISSGILAGEVVNSTLYNCEIQDGTAVCNATQGIAALGGQPLYLGAMVGFATDSVIEYCRVTLATDPTTGQEIEGGGATEVSMHYDTAVGAVAACEVYTGGLVGGANTTKEGDAAGTPTQIIDCFSTADIDSYAACYVSVGAGTAGYVGGIVGRTGQSVNVGGNVNTVYIERCSFAGDLSSRQVNSILVLPIIIEDNKFLAAIVGRDSTNASVSDCYFNASMAAASIEGNTGKIHATQDGTGSGDNVTQGSSFGPKDSDYTNVDFWESCGFDFGGSVERTAKYPLNGDSPIKPTTVSQLVEGGEGHANKWVMDYNIGIPVHGSNIMATFDFPGAGKVVIGTTGYDLIAPVDGRPATSTTNPYDFAQQGFLPQDGTVEITYTEGDNPAEGDETNTGWKVVDWYRQQGVGVTSIPENHDLFTDEGEDVPYFGKGPVIGGEKDPIDAEGDEKLSIKRNNNVEGQSDPEYVDGDLYVAYLQANVLLHDVNGGIVSRESGQSQNGSSDADWYDYNEQLVTPATVANAPAAEGTQLIGWTSVPSGSMNYEAITSTDLDTLREQGVFCPVDENGQATIMVSEPMNLWPVYSNYITNITVIYEGDERDTTDARNIREGFGEANVTVDEQSGDVILTVKPYTDSPLTEGTVRFLGWYEDVDPTDDENWVKVDAGTQPEADDDGNVLNGDGEYTNKPAAGTECFSFNLTQAEVDLTQPHSYKARFEYEVTYYLDSGSDEVVAKLWHQYAQTFKAPQDLDFDYGANPSPFDGWYFGHECYTGTSDEVGDKVESPTHNEVSSEFSVHYPMPVHAHWEEDTPSQDHAREIITTTDFPGSATVTAKHEHDTWLAGDATFSADVNEGYHLKFWSGDYSNGNWKDNNYSATGESEDKNWTVHAATGWGDTAWIEAHMTADVTFKLPKKDDMVVERRYRQKIFTNTRDYPLESIVYYHYDDDAEAGRIKVGVTDVATGKMDPQNYEVGAEARAAAPKGYAFLGWIDHSALTNGEMTQGEWDYIFEDGVAAANGSDITTVQYVTRVVPYLVDEDAAVCTRPTELYPVYVPISIESRTNVREAGVPDGYNLPSIPKVECTSDSETVYNQAYNLSYAPTNPKFPIDGETVVGGETKAEIGTLSYNRRGEAELQVTADLGGPIKDGSDKNYEFVSLTVSIDGEERQLTLEDGTKDESANTVAFTIPITLGHAYVFRANYEPIPVQVTYHMDTEDTEVFDELEVGDKLPIPTQQPSYDNQGFFVGWAEKPAGDTSDSPIGYADDIVFANPGVDTVNHSMDLWPVYRRGMVDVISNQDDTFASAGMELDTIRYVEKRAGDADGLWIVAQDVPGYEFQGWKKQGNDAFITQAHEFRLTGADRFEEGAVYVAHYEKTTVINYHGTDGSIIFSQSVATDEDRYKSDGFIYEVEIEEDKKQDAVYDGEAFGAILSELAAKDGDYYEKFINWQIETDAGTYEEWDSSDPNNFTHKGIGTLAGSDGTVDLYPITIALSAQKPGDDVPVDYTKSVNWAVEAPANEDGTTDADALAVNVLLTEDYSEPWLTVSVDKLVYTADADGSDAQKAPAPDGMADVPVRLYAKDSSGGIALATDVTRDGKDTVSGVTLQKGDAIFTFKGLLQITKTSSDENAAGRTFSFIVESEDKSEKQTVMVTLPKEADESGNYTKSVTLSLPYGEYMVQEDTGWAWRYTVSLQKCLSQGSAWEGMNNGGSVEVKYAGYETTGGDEGQTTSLTPVKVKATNTLDSNKGNWLDGDVRVQNIFGIPNGNAKNGGE